jgi:hypothetical protein
MTAVVLKEFKGEIPRLPAEQLPDGYAQQAINCDFTNKVLSPRRGGFLLATMVNTPVRGIYTDDGLNFYTWTHETNAFKSPVIGDVYSRMYYLDANGVLSTAPLPTAQLTGGPPASAVKVGVPKPTVAPVLESVNRTTLADYPTATLAFAAWYEAGGAQQSKATVTASEVTPFQEYTFAPPARGSAPAEAPLVVEGTCSDGGKTLFKVSSAGGSVPANRSSALPGGIECAAQKVNDTTWKVLLTWGVVETRAYVYTCVNTYNEESAPSPPSIIPVTYMQDVRLTVSIPSFTGYRPFQKVNIYHTFGSSPDYLLVETTSEGNNKYLDSARKPSGGILASTFWKEPVEGLHSLNLMPNGWFVAAKDNVLYASEPYRPSTWPYDKSFRTNIRAVCPMAGGLLVTTADACYIVLGPTPHSMQAQELSVPQAGITNRSTTKVDGGATFATNDGLCLVQGSQATLEPSQSLFDRKTWRDRYATDLPDIMLGYHDGDLIALSRTSTNGFVVKLDDEVKGFTRYQLQADSLFRLPVLDTLYYAVGSNIYRFGEGASVMTADWWSKDYVFQKPINFGAGYIRCDGSTTLTLYADGSQYYQVALTTGYFRLPSGLSQVRWSFRLQTEYVVHELAIAQTLEELNRV